MIRSVAILLLAIVCGSAAAIGVNQVISKEQQAGVAAEISTKPVVIAKQLIPRGAVVTADDVDRVEWPAEFLPEGVVTQIKNATGRTALASIVKGEPVFSGKLSSGKGGGFVSTIVKKGMRAYTIQTSGPSSSVAGFVRPGDHVDVLLNLRGGANEETGGGSTTTLLQAVEILAIDQILDANAEYLKMWAKGGKVTSVTLSVTPEQASLLALGQNYGELSLALRNTEDMEEANTTPTTINQIRYLQLGPDVRAEGGNEADANGQNDVAPPSDVKPPSDVARSEVTRSQIPQEEVQPATYIRTLRGSHSGRVHVVSIRKVEQKAQPIDNME